jgi:hypothetical protein
MAPNNDESSRGAEARRIQTLEMDSASGAPSWKIEGRLVPDDNESVADPSDDQDDSQDVHWQVISGVVADLIGDRESRRRQHEMG